MLHKDVTITGIVAYSLSKSVVIYLSDTSIYTGYQLRPDNFDAIEYMVTLAAFAKLSNRKCDVDEENGIVQSIVVS